jgi:hypothetical protein
MLPPLCPSLPLSLSPSLPLSLSPSLPLSLSPSLPPLFLFLTALEGQAEALTGTFKAQDMANTLWAYAKMGREPGAGMMSALE